MKRRIWLKQMAAGAGAAFLGAVRLRAEEAGRRIGKLLRRDGKPALAGTDGQITFLDGDESTVGVFLDDRVQGKTFEVLGTPKGNSGFLVNPIHTKAMFVLEEGKRLFVTYWCDVCAIRTYTPGKCWCCQEDTELQLRERYDG